MAPLAAYAGSWGTGSPSPNIDREGRWRRRDRRTLEERRAAAAQVTKLLPSRSRCALEVGCSLAHGPVPTDSYASSWRITRAGSTPVNFCSRPWKR